MSARARVLLVVSAAAVAVVGATLLVARGGGGAGGEGAREGAPPLALDLGARTDAEAAALRRAARLYAAGRRDEAARIFRRYPSTAARIGFAFARWPEGTVAALGGLAEERPRDSDVLLHLGLARYWSGDDRAAATAWLDAARAQPGTPPALVADDLLHPGTPEGVPLFVPSFGPPVGIQRLEGVEQLRALERAARRRDVRAKLLYGLALQRLGRQREAERVYAAAARLAPSNVEAQVAAAVGRFTKSDPARAFSRLGPLTRRFSREPTVRFHLGLMLAWLGRLEPAEEQFRKALRADPRDPLAREAKRWLDCLENVETCS